MLRGGGSPSSFSVGAKLTPDVSVTSWGLELEIQGGSVKSDRRECVFLRVDEIE